MKAVVFRRREFDSEEAAAKAKRRMGEGKMEKRRMVDATLDSDSVNQIISIHHILLI